MNARAKGEKKVKFLFWRDSYFVTIFNAGTKTTKSSVFVLPLVFPPQPILSLAKLQLLVE